MSGETPAVEIRALSKTFGAQIALRDLHLSLGQGEFLALLGPNGAGKTTLIRIIASLTRPTSGTVRLWGRDLSREATALRRHIGYISHLPLLYGDLTPEENLRFFARMYDLPDARSHIDQALDRVGLLARRHDPVRTLSRGMVQRLAIARATLCVHDPAIMLLDEPYTGLDLQAADMFSRVLQELALSQRTVVLTTHLLDQALEMGDRIAILCRGRIAWEGKRAGLQAAELREIYREVTGGAGWTQP